MRATKDDLELFDMLMVYIHRKTESRPEKMAVRYTEYDSIYAATQFNL